MNSEIKLKKRRLISKAKKKKSSIIDNLSQNLKSDYKAINNKETEEIRNRNNNYKNNGNGNSNNKDNGSSNFKNYDNVKDNDSCTENNKDNDNCKDKNNSLLNYKASKQNTKKRGNLYRHSPSNAQCSNKI